MRPGKSKDRIDHTTAKSGEVILADQGKDQCELNGEMRAEAENNDNRDHGMQGDEVEVRPEQFDLSGSPAKDPEEEIVLASRTATPAEMRLRTPERTPARKRKTENNDDASHKSSLWTLKTTWHPSMTMSEESR